MRIRTSPDAPELQVAVRQTGLRIEQHLHIFFRESRRDLPLAIEQAVGECALPGLEFIHLFLDRA